MTPRRIAAGLAILLAPSAAFAEDFHAAAQLRAAYDDVAVQTPAGGWKHYGMLAQNYGANVGGPLGLPTLGNGNIAFGWQDGSNVSRFMQGGRARQQQSDVSLTGALFSDDVRKVVNISPFMTRSKFNASSPDGPSRDFIDVATGGTGSVSLPGWPIVAVSYRATAREDSTRPGSKGDATTSREDRVHYTNGPWRFRYERQVRAMTPAGTSAARPESDALQTAAEFQKSNNGLKAWHLQAFNGSAGYSGARTGSAARRGAYTEQMALATERRTLGGVSWYVGLGQGVATVPDKSSPALSHDATLTGSKGLPHIDMSNQIAFANRIGGGQPSNSLRDQLSAETRWWGSRLGWAVQAEGSATWAPGGATAGDSLSQRFSVAPATTIELFGTHAFGTTRPLGGSVLARTNRVGGGGAWRPIPGVEVKGTAERSGSRSRSSAEVVTTTTGAEGRLSVIPGLSFGVTANHQQQTGVGTLSLGADVTWTPPLEGLTLDARVYRTAPSSGPAGRSAATATSDASLGGRYAVGRTQAGIRWETRGLAASSAYRHLVADLTRSF